MSRSMMTGGVTGGTICGMAGGLALVAAAAIAAPAAAQFSSASASPFARGYNQASGEMSAPIDVATRDANGNKLIVDGVTQTGSDNSVFFRRTGGAFDQFTGAGAGGSYAGQGVAIGNNLVVVTQGNYNTVIINAQQTNTGNITATTTVLNGKINLDGGN